MQPLAERLSPEFRPALANLEVTRLDEHPAIIFGLLPDLRLGFVNQRWARFATDNAPAGWGTSWQLGTSFLSAIRGPLRDFYEAQYRHVQRTRQVWEHTYECPSATQTRTYRLRLLPLPGDCLLAVHALVVELPYPVDPALAAIDHAAAYTDSSGLVLQCCHCRRVRRARSRVWDFVPHFVARPLPNVSHGLCEVCLEYYYPDTSLLAAG